MDNEERLNKSYVVYSISRLELTWLADYLEDDELMTDILELSDDQIHTLVDALRESIYDDIPMELEQTLRDIIKMGKMAKIV